jgi:hypothetical protein
MYVGAVRRLLVRQDKAPAGKIAQPGRIIEYLNIGLTVPRQDITTFRLDDCSPVMVITAHGQRHLWHACILRMMASSRIGTRAKDYCPMQVRAAMPPTGWCRLRSETLSR